MCGGGRMANDNNIPMKAGIPRVRIKQVVLAKTFFIVSKEGRKIS